MAPKNIIVDCDAGIDDALGLIILLSAHKTKKIEIKAVTCVNGTTSVDNVIKNVCRTFDYLEVLNIPVYRGASSPLLNYINNASEPPKPYGNDGFYDVYSDEPDITTRLRKANASYALHKIASDNPGTVTIICMGPLTNLALAIKMYPDFVSNVKEFYVMGGNSTAQGNITAQAEFNFFIDPESAHIVLNSVDKPLWLLPWETCLKSRITHEWRKNVLGKMNAIWIEMLNRIENINRRDEQYHFYVSCGAIIAAIVLKSEMAKNVAMRHADVELNGYRTRGQAVLDHLQFNKPNVQLIEDFDSEILKKLLLSSAAPADNEFINMNHH